MKTKEEIRYICGDIIDSESVNEQFKQAVYEGAILGYTQCQEDMADKKYTEEDIRKAIQVGVSAEAGDYPEGFTYKLGITLEDYYINSLNRGDNEQLCKCSSKILQNGKIQLHLCKKCNEELFKES